MFQDVTSLAQGSQDLSLVVACKYLAQQNFPLSAVCPWLLRELSLLRDFIFYPAVPLSVEVMV